MRRIFVDVDGVLADFYGHYFSIFGYRLNQYNETPETMANIRNYHHFYRDIPLLPDALELWGGIKKFDPNPTILTGYPVSVPWAKLDKKIWIVENLGVRTEVIICLSREKYKYGKQGDILIDDRTKFRHLWKNMGGIFILHTSAQITLTELRQIYS